MSPQCCHPRGRGEEKRRGGGEKERNVEIKGTRKTEDVVGNVVRYERKCRIFRRMKKKRKEVAGNVKLKKEKTNHGEEQMDVKEIDEEQ